MVRSIPIPFVALVGLLLAVDGMVAWLASATVWGWGIPWAVGTGLLLGAFLSRLGVRKSIAFVVALVVLVALCAIIYVKGEVIGAFKLDSITAILLFLALFVGEVGVGIASVLTGRASAQGANFWVYVVSALAIAVVLNYLTNRHVRTTYDITQAQLESLSDQTLAKMKGLRKDVHLIAFIRDSDPNRPGYAEMLKKYAAASRYFTFEFVDPDKYPDIAARENINPNDITIIVKCEDRRELVLGPEERDLTTAIIKVTRPGQKRIYFSMWHQERTLEGEMAMLANLLRQLNYATAPLKLIDSDVPPDCAVLVIPGPKAPFAPVEISRIERYLAEGGSALVLLDPDSIETGLENVVARWGVVVHPNMVIERQRGLVPYAGGLYMGEQQSMYARAMKYEPSHAIVADLESKGIATGFYQVREITWTGANPTLACTGTPIVFAGSRTSFAITEVKEALRNPRQAHSAEGKPSGPFSVAVAATAPPSVPTGVEGAKTRLVVVGDADFATDRVVSQERGNVDFMLNCITWLSEDEDLITIHSREPGYKPIVMTASQGTFMFLFCVWRYPAMVFVAGLLIWWYRRSRGPGKDN